MSEANNVRVQKMDSNELGRYVADQTVGVLRRLEELRPLYTELWKRFDNLKRNEKILGCSTKTEYCQRILHRSIRSVQYALNGRAMRRSELDRPFAKLRPVDVEYTEDFVPDYIAEADWKREGAEARKQFEEQCRQEEAERRAWEQAHPEEAERQKQAAEQRQKEFEARREEWRREQQGSQAPRFTTKVLWEVLGGKGYPSADAIREFATLGRRAAATKYHNNGQYPERMTEMNRVADWLEALAE